MKSAALFFLVITSVHAASLSLRHIEDVVQVTLFLTNSNDSLEGSLICQSFSFLRIFFGLRFQLVQSAMAAADSDESTTSSSLAANLEPVLGLINGMLDQLSS
jgi:hypothetical protein